MMIVVSFCPNVDLIQGLGFEAGSDSSLVCRDFHFHWNLTQEKATTSRGLGLTQWSMDGR